MNKSPSINLENLSAKELFDLANKKLQMEQTQARAAELVRKREQLVRTHEQALAEFDRKLQALQRQREQLVAAQNEELSAIDREIAEAGRVAPATSAAAPAPTPTPITPPPVERSPVLSAPAPAPSPIAPEPKPDTPRGPSDDDFTAAIIDAMKGRSDISDSLLREKLRLKGFQVSNLSKQLEKLVREGVVSSKGGGNYALKKRA